MNKADENLHESVPPLGNSNWVSEIIIMDGPSDPSLRVPMSASARKALRAERDKLVRAGVLPPLPDDEETPPAQSS